MVVPAIVYATTPVKLPVGMIFSSSYFSRFTRNHNELCLYIDENRTKIYSVVFFNLLRSDTDRRDEGLCFIICISNIHIIIAIEHRLTYTYVHTFYKQIKPSLRFRRR